MKKNKMMRIASVLLVAVLLTTCAISGTFAKYVTSKERTDTARVAKFGVDLGVTVDGAFATEYDADVTVTDKDGAAIAKTVVSAADDQDNLVAPGTKGDLMASATIAPTSASPAEIAATFAILSLLSTLLLIAAIASTATSVAFFIPLRSTIGFAPAARFFIPS